MDPLKARVEGLEDLVRSLSEGRLKMHELPDDLSAEEKAAVRRAAIERLTGADLQHVGHFSLDAEQAASRHCENFVGVAQIPMGVTGPLRIRGDAVDASEDVFVPLATTEGALLASINRGCRAISAAGGALVRVEDVGMTRAPAFRSSGIEQTGEFLDWVFGHEAEMQEIAASTSRYLKLMDIKPQVFGTSIYLRFRFESGDAMGMNMATIACDRIVRDLIEPATGVSCVALSGNYCVDKKPSAVNFLEGRGKRIHAEVVLEESVLKKTSEDRRPLTGGSSVSQESARLDRRRCHGLQRPLRQRRGRLLRRLWSGHRAGRGGGHGNHLHRVTWPRGCLHVGLSSRCAAGRDRRRHRVWVRSVRPWTS